MRSCFLFLWNALHCRRPPTGGTESEAGMAKHASQRAVLADAERERPEDIRDRPPSRQKQRVAGRHRLSPRLGLWPDGHGARNRKADGRVRDLVELAGQMQRIAATPP